MTQSSVADPGFSKGGRAGIERRRCGDRGAVGAEGGGAWGGGVGGGVWGGAVPPPRKFLDFLS